MSSRAYLQFLRRLRAALVKIDAIRNSIIGTQQVNWSAHIYPLVAALGEAGFDGEGYDVARAKAQSLVEERAEMRAALVALGKARADVTHSRNVAADARHADAMVVIRRLADRLAAAEDSDAETRRLAARAVASCEARKNEDIDEWAERLADDVKDFND